MPSVCFYFQVHQPYRLRRYSVFDTGSDYFDGPRNEQVLARVVDKCYRPATQLLLELIERHAGRFKVSFCLSGVILTQLRAKFPDVIDRFAELVNTGCVELLGETSHHSLAFLYSRREFVEQVDLHAGMMNELFGVTPRVFRHTELIYNNDLAHYLRGMGRYAGTLAEGADDVLGWRNPNHVYHPPGMTDFALLLKNYRLSDDIAFRFSDSRWAEYPLTARKYASWIHRLHPDGDLCNLFMDFETFGEHQWAETGIFDFLRDLPGEVLADGASDFVTPGEAIANHTPVGEFDAPHMISWADTERDLSAWVGNAMQSNALHELYKLEGPVKAANDPDLLEDWRRLTSSDHVYYMCTKYYADGDVHRYFNPYESPYDGYINFMNVMDNLRSRATG